MYGKDYYREWSYQDRIDALRDGDFDACKQYDQDSDSGDRAFDTWRSGGDFVDPEPDNRFS